MITEEKVKGTTMKNADETTSKESMISKEDQILYKRALAAQAQYMNAPQITASERTSDPYKELTSVYAVECKDKVNSKGDKIEAEFTAYFGDPDKIHSDIAKGFVPKFNEHGEKVVGPGGEILYTIPRRLYKARKSTAQKESLTRISAVNRLTARRMTADGVPAPDSSNVRVEKLEIGNKGEV